MFYKQQSVILLIIQVWYVILVWALIGDLAANLHKSVLQCLRGRACVRYGRRGEGFGDLHSLHCSRVQCPNQPTPTHLLFVHNMSSSPSELLNCSIKNSARNPTCKMADPGSLAGWEFWAVKCLSFCKCARNMSECEKRLKSFRFEETQRGPPNKNWS